MQRTKSKRRVRARSRGAAMLEAALVMPVLVSCWVAGVYAQSACSAKLDAIATARADAWDYASANCGDAGDHNPSPGANVTGAHIVAIGVSPQNIVEAIGSGRALDIILKVASAYLTPAFPGAQAENTREARITSASGEGPKLSSKHTSKMTVACNEAPYDGNFMGLFKDIWFMVTK